MTGYDTIIFVQSSRFRTDRRIDQTNASRPTSAHGHSIATYASGSDDPPSDYYRYIGIMICYHEQRTTSGLCSGERASKLASRSLSHIAPHQLQSLQMFHHLSMNSAPKATLSVACITLARLKDVRPIIGFRSHCAIPRWPLFEHPFVSSAKQAISIHFWKRT